MRLQKRGLYAGLLLLAMGVALLPTVARAESSSEIVYPLAGAGVHSQGIETPPKPKRHHVTKPGTGEEPPPAETTTAPEGEPESEEGRQAQAVAPNGNGGHPPKGGGHPKPGTTPKSKPTAQTRSAGQTEPATKPIKLVSADTEEGGGSSPVVPILIVVAVLAALSIGTVIYRGRTPQAG